MKDIKELQKKYLEKKKRRSELAKKSTKRIAEAEKLNYKIIKSENATQKDRYERMRRRNFKELP